MRTMMGDEGLGIDDVKGVFAMCWWRWFEGALVGLFSYRFGDSSSVRVHGGKVASGVGSLVFAALLGTICTSCVLPSSKGSNCFVSQSDPFFPSMHESPRICTL